MIRSSLLIRFWPKKVSRVTTGLYTELKLLSEFSKLALRFGWDWVRIYYS